mmetsp:Transcript_57108/g.185614  ORF Transcript_57108/g.185614 Transcript_57108/m.185614 type:complete len:354 (-) Transcript_57108:1179-2240(-)
MAPGHDLLEHAEEHVGVQGALVRLVHDDGAISVQVRLDQGLAQKNAICHVLDDGFVRGDVFEADGVTNRGSQLAVHLVGHALGHGDGSHSSGLGATDEAVDCVVSLVEVLRELRGLTRACLSDADHDLVLPQQVQQLFPNLEDGQRLPLLVEGLRLRELGLRHVLLPHHGLAILAALLVVVVLVLHVVLHVALLLLHAEDAAHVRTLELPEARAELALIRLLAHLLHDLGALLGEHGHVRGGIFHGRHGVGLLGVDDAAVQEGRRRLPHLHGDALLLVVLRVVQAELLSLAKACLAKAIELPHLVRLVLRLLPQVDSLEPCRLLFHLCILLLELLGVHLLHHQRDSSFLVVVP